MLVVFCKAYTYSEVHNFLDSYKNIFVIFASAEFKLNNPDIIEMQTVSFNFITTVLHYLFSNLQLFLLICPDFQRQNITCLSITGQTVSRPSKALLHCTT